MVSLIVNAIPLNNLATGVGRYMRCLYTELERSHRRDLDICYFNGSSISRKMPCGPENIRSWSMLTNLFWKLPPRLALAVRVARHARMEQRFSHLANGFDCYHEAGFFPFRAPAGVKTIFTIHDMSIARHPEHHPRERVLYMNRYLYTRARWASRYLAVSKFTKAEAVALLGIDPMKVTVTHLAPDPVFTPRLDTGLSERLSALGLPERYFLFVGSGDPRKNAHRIPKALLRSGVDVPLVSVGWSGWNRIDNGNSILALGYISDAILPDLYSGALALVYPSSYEGFGLPIAEAMACGCPVIAARKASLPEIGGNAVLYVDDPTNEEELANVLRRITQNGELRKNLFTQGIEQSSHFTWAKTAQRTRDVILSAVHGP